MTDEFVEPIVMRARRRASPSRRLQDGDSVIFFNFRADRARQITSALAVPGFDDFPTPRPPAQSHFVCFADLRQDVPAARRLPARRSREHPRGRLRRQSGVRNYRMAETEKYAHVTYFFNGGTEHEFPHERRLLVPSPKVATYDLAPEMSAFKVTDKILRAIDEGETDVFIVNFANPDMVGHTGNLDKTIEAVPVRRHLSRLDYESAFGRRAARSLSPPITATASR